MKKILFDLLNSQPSGNSKFHGGGEYIKTVFERLATKYSNECLITVFYNTDLFIDDWIKELIKEKNIEVCDIKKIEDIKYIFENKKFDIFYSGLPYQLKKEYIPENVCKIGTIHGLRPLEKTDDKYRYEYEEKRHYLKEKLKKLMQIEFKNSKKQYFETMELLDKIICVSEHTKYSISNYYPNVSLDKIKVFYTPEKKMFISNKIEDDNKKFILLIGGDRWIKNVYRAIISIEQLLDEDRLKDYKVVIVGKISKIIYEKIKHKDRYELLNYVETEKLEYLYKNCDFFIYPTLNEGFGMPPLEAMKYGKTCIVSAVTSLPEVCGDAVYYINPYDIYEIRNRILMAEDKKIPIDIINNQLEKINNRQRLDLDRACEYIIQ